MNQKPPTPSDAEIARIADEFQAADFTSADISEIKKTRRRTPRLGEAKAEVYTFRAPPSYKKRIKRRAHSDERTESQVIRDALDAYL